MVKTMNHGQNVIKATLVLLSFFAVYANAIKCYQCSSVNDTRCNDIRGDNSSLIFLKECDGNYHGKQPFCRKTTQTSTSIKCHVCNSKQDANCVDPFNLSTTLQECEYSGRGHYDGKGKTLDVIEIIMQSLDAVSANDNDDGQMNVSDTPDNDEPIIDKPIMVCEKIVVTVGNESITGRGCSPHLVDGMHPCDAVKLSAPQQAVATPTIHVRHCVTCFGDACNSSAHKMPTFIFILMISYIGFHCFYTIF